MFAAMAVAVSFTSCKSSESAYKKAYEKAKAAEEKSAGYVTETVNTIEETTTYVPTVEKQTYTETPVQSYQQETVPTRQESYSMIDGEGLKAYSVVVGSFGVKANAERLQGTLRGQGYNAQIVRTANNLYRVVAASSDSMSDIVSDKNRLKSSYADAWILRK